MAPSSATPSESAVGRLSLYRGILNRLMANGQESLYSHEMGALARVTPSQVRRDLMALGYSGSPAHGYEVRALEQSIGKFLDAPTVQNVVLIGVGNLGRAILTFFAGRRPNLKIVAAFDNDPHKVDRVICSCRCHPLEEMEGIVREQGIGLGIVAVPAEEAQSAADALVRLGVRGILNCAPVRLRMPDGVYVEDLNMAVSLDKVAYFARHMGHQ